ncbi:c-type cytochrome [Halomonas sp. GXIMD04776]|uniref:c-type cytochrome n=1 Tax=Halomonas sp. GXIMD04776 TaxID=3415605 RepID=UPI003CA431C3
MRILTTVALVSCAAFAVTAQAAGDAEAGAEKITTCVACHGKDGKATAPIYPNLAGQSAQYLESSLKAYREGQRGGGMSMMMTPMAKQLSDEDIADLAAYYSQQTP